MQELVPYIFHILFYYLFQGPLSFQLYSQKRIQVRICACLSWVHRGCFPSFPLNSFISYCYLSQEKKSSIVYISATFSEIQVRNHRNYNLPDREPKDLFKDCFILLGPTFKIMVKTGLLSFSVSSSIRLGLEYYPT